MGLKAIDENCVVRAAPDHLLANLDDAAVLLHLGSGQYFSLGGSATRIWQLLQEPTVVASLIEQLVAQFAVDAARCRVETLSLLERLAADGLLTVQRD